MACQFRRTRNKYVPVSSVGTAWKKEITSEEQAENGKPRMRTTPPATSRSSHAGTRACMSYRTEPS